MSSGGRLFLAVQGGRGDLVGVVAGGGVRAASSSTLRCSTRAGLARPVRTVARSRRRASSAFSMRSVASRRASSIMASPLSLGGGGCVLQYRLEVADDGAVVLSGGGELDAARHAEVEDDNGEGVFHAEGECGGVHHLEAAVKGVQVAEAQELSGGGGDHAALLQVANGAAADVRLRDGGDGNRALRADPEPVPLQRVLQGEGVDDGGQHAGVVGGGAVHAGGGGGGAAKDVPGADHDGGLDPHALARPPLPGGG